MTERRQPTSHRGMHFGVSLQSYMDMLTDIEEVVIKELNGLCGSCIHAADCVYRKNSQKVVIQCEVFESNGGTADQKSVGDTTLRGLCLNCSKSHFCSLPKEASGVWHCEEYE